MLWFRYFLLSALACFGPVRSFSPSLRPSGWGGVPLTGKRNKIAFALIRTGGCFLMRCRRSILRAAILATVCGVGLPGCAPRPVDPGALSDALAVRVANLSERCAGGSLAVCRAGMIEIADLILAARGD